LRTHGSRVTKVKEREGREVLGWTAKEKREIGVKWAAATLFNPKLVEINAEEGNRAIKMKVPKAGTKREGGEWVADMGRARKEKSVRKN